MDSNQFNITIYDTSSQQTLTPSPVILHDSENIGLLSLEMNTPINVVGDVSKSPDLPLVYPFGDYTPRAMFSRPFEYAEITVNPSWTGTRFSLRPRDFYNRFCAMDKFTWGRFGIKARFVISSTATHQGSIIVGYLPQIRGPIQIANVRSGFVSMCNSTIMSITGENDLEYNIPYVSPYEGLELGSLDAMAHLFVYPLTPFRANGASSNIKIKVYLSMVDPFMWGLVRHDPPAFEKQSLSSEKANKEKDTTSKTMVTKVSNVIKSLPYVGEPWRNFADFLNSTEFSKPPDTRFPTPMVPRTTSGLFTCDSMSLSEPLSPQADALLDPTNEKFESTSMTLLELASRPALFEAMSFSLLNDERTISWRPEFYNYVNFDGMRPYPSADFLAHVTRAHNFWRGGVKIAIYFTTNAYTSARFLLRLWTSGSGSDITDIMSSVIDVKGDTWYNFIIPYINNSPWIETEQTVAFPYPPGPVNCSLTMQNITSPNASNTPYVDVAMFRGAAPDFQVALPCIPISNLDQFDSSSLSASTIAFRKESRSLNELFRKEKFKPFVSDCVGNCGEHTKPKLGYECKRSNPECPKKIIDMLKRNDYHSRTQFQGPVDSGDITANERRIQYYWGSLFLFYRGSVVLTRIHNPEGYFSFMHLGPDTYPSAPIPITSLHAPSVFYEYYSGYVGRSTVPYYSTLPFWYSAGSSVADPIYWPTTNNLPNNQVNLMQVGDDYEGLFLIPPVISSLLF